MASSTTSDATAAATIAAVAATALGTETVTIQHEQSGTIPIPTTPVRTVPVEPVNEEQNEPAIIATKASSNQSSP